MGGYSRGEVEYTVAELTSVLPLFPLLAGRCARWAASSALPLDVPSVNISCPRSSPSSSPPPPLLALPATDFPPSSVHSIAAALFLPKDQIHFADTIAYFHNPFRHCPLDSNTRAKGCSCDPNHEDNFEFHGSPLSTAYTCLACIALTMVSPPLKRLLLHAAMEGECPLLALPPRSPPSPRTSC